MVGPKAKNVDEYRLRYSSNMTHRSRIGIIVDEELWGHVIEVKWINDRLMLIELIIGESTLNIIRVYAISRIG